MVNVILVLCLGHDYFTEKYVSKKVKVWSEEILTLSFIAETHSTCCAFVQGVIPKWNCVMQTIESVDSLFQPLKEVIHQHL